MVELKLSQQLVMTPQLQMAIRLLGLPLAGLRDELPKLVAASPPLETREREARAHGPFDLVEGASLAEAFVWHEDGALRVEANEAPYPTFVIYGHELPLRLGERDPEEDFVGDFFAKHPHTDEERAFARAGLWLFRAIEQRARSITKLVRAMANGVAREVFTDPTLTPTARKVRDLADELAIHESTILRMTSSGQTLRCARGDLPLSAFVKR